MPALSSKRHPLRAYRMSRGLSQEGLGVLIGVGRALITHIENGRRRITPEKAIEWEKKIGIPRATLCPEIFGKEAA